MDKINQGKLKNLNNKHIIAKVKEAIELCKPAKVTVITDSKEDINYVRELALAIGEEKKLKMEGHTILMAIMIRPETKDTLNTFYLKKSIGV